MPGDDIQPLGPALGSRQKLPPVVTRDREVEDHTGLDRVGEPHPGELLGSADIARFGEHPALRADLAVEVTAQRRLALLAQRPGALLDDAGRDRL